MANCIAKIFEGGSNMKFVIPDANFLNRCNSSRYDLTETFMTRKISAVSKVISFT